MRVPMLIGFSTASSESVYPKMLEQLVCFGVPERIASFVLPIGYRTALWPTCLGVHRLRWWRVGTCAVAQPKRAAIADQTSNWRVRV